MTLRHRFAIILVPLAHVYDLLVHKNEDSAHFLVLLSREPIKECMNAMGRSYCSVFDEIRILNDEGYMGVWYFADL